jgi:protein-disulfide isomerase
MPTRRDALLLTAAFFASPARAAAPQAFDLTRDDRQTLRNYRVPVELDPGKLPGIIWKGPEDADVALYEFSDYNCGYCRRAAMDLEALLAEDKRLKFGLLNHAILSMGSAQAAKVQQGVLRLHGPKVAYDFHMRMFSRRGQADGASALAVAKEMGLDPKKVEESGDNPAVTLVLTRQAETAQALGMHMTPSFVIAGVAFLGWPGGAALRSMIANVRRCGEASCSG